MPGVSGVNQHPCSRNQFCIAHTRTVLPSYLRNVRVRVPGTSALVCRSTSTRASSLSLKGGGVYTLSGRRGVHVGSVVVEGCGVLPSERFIPISSSHAHCKIRRASCFSYLSDAQYRKYGLLYSCNFVLVLVRYGAVESFTEVEIVWNILVVVDDISSYLCGHQGGRARVYTQVDCRLALFLSSFPLSKHLKSQFKLGKKDEHRIIPGWRPSPSNSHSRFLSIGSNARRTPSFGMSLDEMRPLPCFIRTLIFIPPSVIPLDMYSPRHQSQRVGRSITDNPLKH